MTDADRKLKMGALVKLIVSSSALETQMKIWCYREVGALAAKHLKKREFLNVSATFGLRRHLTYIS